MAHDPSLAYADYFAAAGGGGGAVAATTTLVPELDAGDEDHHLYAVPHHGHGHGVEMFGVRGLVPDAAMAASSAAHGKRSAAALGLGHVVDASSPVGGGHFALGDHEQHQHHLQLEGYQQAPPPFTSLSLHGPAEAAPSSSLLAALHQHHGQLGAGGAHSWQHQQGAWHLRGSRFLRPTQQLLQEFCSLPVEATGSPAAAAAAAAAAASSKPPTTKPANEDGAGDSASSAPPTRIQAMDAGELQRLKGKLYAMLEEVDRRYRRYREQMRAVAGSFEAVAGERAAAAYTRLASRTISRHFRSLRDGVAAQMQAVRAALGEKDAAGGGAPAAKGETTPRLRVLDQCLRQHRAYQAGALESQPWRPQRGLPERAVSILRAWLFEHFLHPYPSDVDKHILARQTGLSRSQVSNWFINARVRLWKPMVEEMYAEEMKDDPAQDGGGANGGGGASNNPSSGGGYGSELGQHHQQGPGAGGEDGERKPSPAQLMVHHDAGSLASVVSIGRGQPQQSIDFGTMDGGHHFDFGAYGGDDGHGAAAGGYGFGLGTGVSLTLGLQQHGRDDPHGGVNIAFAGGAADPPAGAAHEFLFVPGGAAAADQQAMVAGGGHHGQFGAGIEAAGGDDAVGASHYHRPGGLGGAATGFQLLRDLAG